VVHRDIKPANLLLDKKGLVQILDMRLARLDTGDADQADLTSTGQVMGTVDYMAPEQAISTKLADARSDIYSLGISLWYLVTGRAAYEGDSLTARLMAHQQTPIPSLVQYGASADLNIVFQKMVAKQPEDRYQSMAEVVVALSGLGDFASSPTLDVDTSESRRLNEFLQASSLPSDLMGNQTEALASPPTEQLQQTLQVDSANVDTSPKTEQMLAPTLVADAKSLRRQAKSPSNGWIIAAAVSGAACLLLFLAGVVIFLQGPEGSTLRVEINDPQIEVAIQGADITLKQADQGKDVKLSPGQKTLIVQRGDFKFETDKLILKKGEMVTVRVEVLAGQVRVHQGANLLGQGKLPSPKTKPLGEPPRPAKAPFDADEAKRHQQAWADHLGVPVERDITLPGGEKLMMLLIPPGEFLMGSNDEERTRFLEEEKAAEDQWLSDRIPSEGPQHRVRITRPFYLGKHEITQAQWESVMGSNPSSLKDTSHPVEQVSWNDIQPFLAKLNDRGGADKMKFALPTEAQWEYACRSGTTTPYYGGGSENDLPRYGWCNANSGGKPHPVGELKPNAFGLYDMHGNVWEWCVDWHAGDYYAKSSVDDPTGPSAGSPRVLRGGSWNDRPRICRSALRYDLRPTSRGNLGFRLASVMAEKRVSGSWR